MEPREWTPGARTGVVWNVLALPLAVIGLAVFGGVYAAAHGGSAVGVVDPSHLLPIATIFVALLVAHELIHGAAMRAFGATPRYGAGVIGRVMPYLYCTAPGHLFRKSAYLLVALAPFLTISLVGGLWIAFGPGGGWLVLPLGLHFAGCIGDIWVAALALRQTQGALFEDLKTGVRVHPPARHQEA